MTEKLIIFLTCSSLWIQYSISQTSNNAKCSPSSNSCGVIPNISYPFRLKNDPKNCGEPGAEIACENNVATFYINSHRYYVREINYQDLTIRLSHILTPTDNISSSSSICKYFSSSVDDGYLFWAPYSINGGITFISCAYPLQNSSLLTKVTDCEEGLHTYLKVGVFNPTDVDYMCTVKAIIATSWNFTDLNDTVSLSEIHESLFYGFNLSWFSFVCGYKCRFGCSVGSNGLFICDKHPSALHYKWGKTSLEFTFPILKFYLFIYFHFCNLEMQCSTPYGVLRTT